jgi:hypothetical protein
MHGSASENSVLLPHAQSSRVTEADNRDKQEHLVHQAVAEDVQQAGGAEQARGKVEEAARARRHAAQDHLVVGARDARRHGHQVQRGRVRAPALVRVLRPAAIVLPYFPKDQTQNSAVHVSFKGKEQTPTTALRVRLHPKP